MLSLRSVYLTLQFFLFTKADLACYTLPRSRGSNTSLRASPNTLKEKTARVIDTPGAIATWGARESSPTGCRQHLAPRWGRRGDAQPKESEGAFCDDGYPNKTCKDYQVRCGRSPG